MYDQLPIVLHLQEIDGEIDKVESEKERIPAELQALEAELAKHRGRFQFQSDALEELRKERRTKERQLGLQQDKLEKYKSQRLSVRTNKEYTALENEIAELEERNSAIEDEILELIEGEKPSVLQRKKLGDRILKKILSFVKIFINGITGS